jgi:hypothetical protein
MRSLRIRALKAEDTDCLMRELAVYSPRRSHGTILVEIEERSEMTLLGLFSALDTCLSANDIRSVRIELDERSYMLAPSARG